MNKKLILSLILIPLCLAIIAIILFKINNRYNNYVVTNSKWNSIVASRTLSSNISPKDIRFNDYPLLVDEENNIIYYSLVSSKKQYNPLVFYLTNNKLKIAFNRKITESDIDSSSNLQLLIYNDNEYRLYTLVITKYPLINFNYQYHDNSKKIPVDITIFDNNNKNPQKIIKSMGKLTITNNKEQYLFSLSKESLGHNKRDNEISLFGLEKEHEYMLTKNINNQSKNIKVFINNKYIGIYAIEPNRK